MTIRKVNRFQWKIFHFIENWMDRKILANRELTLIESIMLILFAWPIHKLTNPYT